MPPHQHPSPLFYSESCLTGNAPSRKAHQIRDGSTRPLCGLLNLAVAEMCVSERHADIGMTEQARGHQPLAGGSRLRSPGLLGTLHRQPACRAGTCDGRARLHVRLAALACGQCQRARSLPRREGNAARGRLRWARARCPPRSHHAVVTPERVPRNRSRAGPGEPAGGNIRRGGLQRYFRRDRLSIGSSVANGFHLSPYGRQRWRGWSGPSSSGSNWRKRSDSGFHAPHGSPSMSAAISWPTRSAAASISRSLR